jgi:hypothetical protein
MFFPIKLKGHLRLMESDLEPMHDTDSSEPILEIVEGDAASPKAETSIVPNAFETVLAQRSDGPPQNPIEADAPPYKNRAFIAAVCVVGGILAGRFTTQPVEKTVYVDKDRPVLVANQNPSPSTPRKIDNAFRDLADLKDFDPWQPMNGGFPLPPKETQANIVSRSGSPSTEFRPTPPPRMRGDITPLDPTEIGGPLPDIRSDAVTMPANPVPGGGNASKVKPGQDSNSTTGTQKDEPAGKERYVAMSVTGADPSQGQSTLAGLASSLGGSARTFSHMTEDGSLEAQGILMIIPASKYEQAKSRIEALGGASIDTMVEGNASSEQSKIQGMFVSRLAKLREKQKDLLVDFLDDAQPVKLVKEGIDFETRAVSATRLPGGLAGKVVIRVLLR